MKDAVLEKILEVAQILQPGDPLDPKTKMGAMVDETQMKRVLGYIEAGSKEGAKLAFGGKRVRSETGGYYIEPTVFDGVKNSMKIAQEEIFGPVLSTITFKDQAEAVKLANDTIYGLAAAVWTSDITKALQDVGCPARRRGVGQLLRQRPHLLAVRRLQAVRLRPRQVAARDGQVHAAEGDLDQHQLMHRLIKVERAPERRPFYFGALQGRGSMF